MAERADMAFFSAGRCTQQQGQQQHQRYQLRQQRQQQYRNQRPPPPLPRTGPVQMDLVSLQGYQTYGQNLSQYSATKRNICYRYGKQYHKKKDCKAKLRGPQQQQARLNWGYQQPQFSWVQQPPTQSPQYYPFQRQMPNYNHMYTPPNVQQPNGTVPLQQSQQQPKAQVPPPLPLSYKRGSY